MMAALKCLSDNSNICVISVWHLLSFFFWFEIFLVLGMTNAFLLKSGHFRYYDMRTSYLNLLALLWQKRMRVGTLPHYFTDRWSWKSRFPTWPPINHGRVCGLITTKGGKSHDTPLGLLWHHHTGDGEGVLLLPSGGRIPGSLPRATALAEIAGHLITGSQGEV